jgi:outer membrane protein assembly factor BamD (BamD/ComL family)
MKRRPPSTSPACVSRRVWTVACGGALAAGLVASPFSAPPFGASHEPVAHAQGGEPARPPSLGAVAEQQRTPEKERLDAAIRLLREEQYAPAAVALHELATSPDAKAVEEQAAYNLGKALYRLRLNHSALTWFQRLLDRGPDGRFYRASLEWSLFIARKIAADDRVLEIVAKSTDGQFPDEYRNEFRYLLARHHYLRAQAIESGQEVGQLGETRVEETATGGLSLKGDVFGDEPEPDKKAEDDAAVKKKAGGGFSIQDDIFGSDDDGAKADEPRKSPKKKRAKVTKKKKGRRGAAADDSADEAEASGESARPESARPESARPEPAPPARADAEAPKGPEATKAPASEVPKVGGELNAKEHLEAAKRYLVQVDAASPFGAKAKFLEGVLFYRDKRDNDALDAFKSVVRMTKPGAPQEDRYLRQLAFFQLARAHFGAKQPSFSIYYYDRVERLTYEWLEAIYEASWAEFRLGSYEKSLGNLMTLHSPFFENEYFPESLVLKAVVYYENCRYPEAKEILDRFTKRYEPVLEELKQMTSRSLTPDKYFELLGNLRSDELAEGREDKARILAQILSLALSDDELAKLDASAREVDAELKALDGTGPVMVSSRLRAQLQGELEAVRADFQKATGRAVKRRLEGERDAIKGLLQQAIRIDIETNRAEQERIESTLREVQSAPKNLAKEYVSWTDDGRLVWPFEGEYWLDELGTYEMTLGRSCR